MNIITEDNIIEWVNDNDGLLNTRNIVNFRNINDYNGQNIICITGYDSIIQNIFKIINIFYNPFILIILETDFFTLTDEMLNQPLLKHIYCWNKPFDHEKISAIPIGLNHSRQYEALTNWKKENKISFNREKLLCINFSPETNNIRGELVNKGKNEWNDFCDIFKYIPNQKSYWKQSNIEGKILVNVTNPLYYHLINKYKFILSPPGAGPDCHRTWEALYIGCIPIVISSSINELYEDLPILVINDWNEINKEFLEQKYIEIRGKKERGEYNMDKLYLQYWLDKTQCNIPKVLHQYNFKDPSLSTCQGLDNGNKTHNKLIVNHNAGFYSCCSIKLFDIIKYINKNKRSPDNIICNNQFIDYKNKHDLINNVDITNKFFDIDYNPVIYDNNIITSSDERELQFSNYKLINFKDLNPLINKYFKPNEYILNIVSDIEQKLNIDYNKLISVYYRSTDKYKETNIPDIQEYIDIIKIIKKKNPNFKILFITDELKYLSHIKYIFKDDVFFVNELNEMLYKRGFVHAIYMLSILLIVAKSHSIILNSCNVSNWIVLYRNNCNNVYQYLNPKEYIYNIKNKYYGKNVKDFWLSKP